MSVNTPPTEWTSCWVFTREFQSICGTKNGMHSAGIVTLHPEHKCCSWGEREREEQPRSSHPEIESPPIQTRGRQKNQTQLSAILSIVECKSVAVEKVRQLPHFIPTNRIIMAASLSNSSFMGRTNVTPAHTPKCVCVCACGCV